VSRHFAKRRNVELVVILVKTYHYTPQRTLQHALQHTLQHTPLKHLRVLPFRKIAKCHVGGEESIINTLPHTATHCNTLQHTATHCNTLQHTATHCNTLQHIEIHCTTLHHTAPHCTTLQHTAPHCNTLQRTATARCRVASNLHETAHDKTKRKLTPKPFRIATCLT